MKNIFNICKYKIPLIPWSIPFVILIISCLGLIALFSAAEAAFFPWVSKQVPRLFLGFFLMIIIPIINLRFFFKYAYFFYCLSIILLISVDVLGFIGMGAKRWIQIGKLTIQPSEIIKLTLLLALARYFHTINYENFKNISFLFFPIFLVIIPIMIVLKQPDLGTATIIGFMSLCIFFTIGIPNWTIITFIIIIILFIPILWPFLHNYQKLRIITFLNPEIDPLGNGYHIIQSKIALGSGGIWGCGFLKGSQSHLNFLPEKQTDFIFTMFCEEWGFTGGSFLILLYTFLIFLGYKIAKNSISTFGKILATGISSILFLYVFVNISMVTGLLPIVGIPLPFMSYGGTSLIILLISYGLLLSVNVHSRARLGENEKYLK